jgi:hypothetical protein
MSQGFFFGGNKMPRISEAYKDQIRNELYARVVVAVKPHYLEDGMFSHFYVQAKTRLPDNLSPTIAIVKALSADEAGEAMTSPTLIEVYKTECCRRLYESIDTYCAKLGEEDDKVLS